MRKGISQLLTIFLIVVLAFGCGFGGAYSLRYIESRGVKLPGLSDTPALELLGGVNTDGDDTMVVNGITLNVNDNVGIAEAIAAKVMPSVVGISTVSTQSYGYGGFFGWNPGGFTYDTESVGTGVVVDSQGYILTNSHVVNDGKVKSITVSLYDGSDVEGEVLWNDATLDLAIVKVDGFKKNLVAAELGNSDLMNIGSYAAAIGNPLGLNFERSMSQGIISGLNRSISVSSGTSSTTMEGLMQTDATINSGNSGGPLLNSRGQVIGINTAKASSGEGMGFAIPINVAKPIIEQVMDTGSFVRPYIGISGIGLQDQSVYTNDRLMEEFGTTEGIYVSEVIPGGGAEAAGIMAGDVIVELEGEAVGTMNKLDALLIKYAIGDSVELTVLREGQALEFSVVLKDSSILSEKQ